MYCELCQKRDATIFVKKIENGRKIEYNLCEICATEIMKPSLEILDVDGDFFSNLADMLAGFSDMEKGGPGDETKCLKCGMTAGEFQENGRFGCENCYEVFGEKLKPLLKRLQGAAQHAGKYPLQHEEKQEVEKLKEELKKLIENEEYECAAVIRDKIKELEKQKNGDAA